MSPITFHPIYMERIWGSRQLETLYKRQLPVDHIAYGEAWEIVDRDDAQSIVEDGEYAGLSLNELWSNHREEIFGAGLPNSERFPILIKILDCAKDLSIQVHPPIHVAKLLNGEPKTEMWYIADLQPQAQLYVGLRNGITKESFYESIQSGDVADKVHAIQPNKGDSIFIESGRLHAIGAGFLIHEIQQNSDTTYRVFDWNRIDSNGQTRQLHIEESMQCIDFNDFEPKMDTPRGKLIASCPYFKTTLHHLHTGDTIGNENIEQFSIVTVVDGQLNKAYHKGQSVLLPKGNHSLKANEDTTILRITLPAADL